MNHGFTLLEVLVALVIVVAALSVIAQGFFAGADSSITARNETTAATLAGRKMAELESGEISLSQGSSGTFEDVEGFRFEVTSEKDTTGIYTVSVTVTYPDRGGEERSVVLHRLMRERPTTP